MRDNGGESRRNSNQHMELRSYRVLLDNAGDSNVISFLSNELQRSRVLLDNAPTRSLPASLRLRLPLPLAQRRVLRAPLTLRVRVLATPLTVLLRAPPEVARLPFDPCRLRRLPPRALTLRRAARDLPLADPGVRVEPLPTEATRSPAPSRRHRRLLAARRGA